MESNQVNPPKEKLSEKKNPVEEQENKKPFWDQDWEKWEEYRI